MKFRCALVISLLPIVIAGTAWAQTESPDVFAQAKALGRGVNIIGYDPIWWSRQQARFQEKHFRLLKEGGFDSVRINLAPFHAMNRTNDWAISPKWFEVMDWAVAGAQKYGLAVILDLHEFGEMGRDPEGNKPKLLAAWRQISAHCQSLPDSVFFEALNEPNGKLTAAGWNQLFAEILAIMREKNPTRAVIVGPASWNSVDHVKELELPENDRHLILTVHYYKPMEFTHQGASWTKDRYPVGVEWNGTDAQLAVIDKDFDSVAAWAREHNRPVFLGEFGAYDKGPMDSRARYTAAVARAAEKRGWSWAYWQFDSNFLLYDIDHDAWIGPIRDALVPPGSAR